jgi:hypothetical protein
MIRKIGMNAGIIWKYLDSNGGCSSKKLKERLKMNDKDFFWLWDGWLVKRI